MLIWLVLDTHSNAAIWLVRDTHPNAAMWLMRAENNTKIGSWDCQSQNFLQSFHDVQIKLTSIFLQGKSLFSIACRRRLCEIILRCLSSIIESPLELKNITSDSNGKMPSLQKTFPLNFHDAPITPFKTFLLSKACFVQAPFWNYCEMFVVFCSTSRDKQ